MPRGILNSFTTHCVLQGCQKGTSEKFQKQVSKEIICILEIFGEN
jgi:hypothetical protein